MGAKRLANRPGRVAARVRTAAAGAVLCGIGPASADTIFVPDDHPTIQEAVIAASDGDEIVVRPDVYVERVDFLGRALIVRSTDPGDPQVVATTVIDGDGAGTVVTLSRGTLRGFTIRNGWADEGGGIRATGVAEVLDNVVTENASGAILADGDVLVDGNWICGNIGGGVIARTRTVVSHNVIADNAPSGGVRAEHNSTVRSNTIAGNRASSGGGVFASGNAAIRSNVIVGNRGSSEGGGIYADDHFGAITGNTLVGNVSATGSGIDADRGAISSNIIAFSPSSGVAFRASSAASADYNCVFGNNGPSKVSGEHDVEADPLFQPGRGGEWTADAVFDQASFTTTMTDATATFVEGALSGRIINPDLQQALRFAIVANTETTITVIGDASALAEDGDDYQVFDIHLADESPCIDAGDPTGNVGLYEGDDFDGDRRLQNCAIDIGADETDGSPTTVLVVESTMTTPRLDVSRPDCFGRTGGSGRFNRFYDDGSTVTLTAEALFEGLPFRWVVDGDEGAFGQLVVTVNMTDHVVARAEYFPVTNLTRNAYFTGIQEAISSFSTQDLDEIVVYPSVYMENVDFLGKAITVRSVDPLDPAVVASTVIDGGHADTVVSLFAGEITGFTIRNGGAVATSTAGGVYADGTSRVTRNLIEDNFAWQSGAGVAARGTALIAENTIRGNRGSQTGVGVSARDDAVVIGNWIIDNVAAEGEGGGASVSGILCDNVIENNQARSGGGVYATGQALVFGNTVIGNVATNRGGGIYAREDTTVAGNVIMGNESRDLENGGGGVYAGGRDLIIDNAIIANTSLGPGGGMHLALGADAIGNTVVDNACGGRGGGIFATSQHEMFVLLHNVVAFNDGSYGIYSEEVLASDYSCVFGNEDGAYGGLALPGAHDLFVDPRLDDDRIHVTAGSPCIDAGDPAFGGFDGQTDIDGDPRVLEGRVDIGADEYRPDPCPADVDDNGAVDFADVLAVLLTWGPCPPPCPEDLDDDGAVGFADLIIVLSSWGACPVHRTRSE